MDTNKLKRFATEARNKIRQGVARKLLALGFSPEGEPTDFPRQLQGVTLYRGQQLEESFHDKWVALYEAIQRHGVGELCEEVAYTWFNRLIAIRILQKNGFIDCVLSFDNAAIRVPHIVSEARQGRTPAMDTAERLRLRTIINDPTKTYEQFALLITAFCHATPILHRCFGSIDDYTSLLLPDDILDEGGFIGMLNNTTFITDDDYRTTELLGWLYQFYIAEKKDDVFASFKSGHKAEAEDIPAATQIFTPNWIVRYMVENTLGRIYLDNNPDSELLERMPYLVPKAEEVGEDAIYAYDRLEDLRIIDPACGSGHILLEAFDLLFAMYQADFYSRQEAVEAIFAHNLIGIDLDTRAKQLAQFALLLKACQKDASFVDAHAMPRVFDMPRCDRYTWSEASGHFDCHYHLDPCSAPEEIRAAFELMEQADTLGSTMRFDVGEATRHYLTQCVERYDAAPAHSEAFAPLVDGFRLVLALTDSYAAVIANPPYMGSGNMNATLSQYVRTNYAEGKADLFSVFMLVAERLLQPHGKYGMINMQSWMFLSSFEALRRKVLTEQRIDSMLHLGPHTFDELSGEVVQNTAFVITQQDDEDDAAKSCGTYYRLVDAPNCDAKAMLFRAQTAQLADANGTVTTAKPIVYKNIPQSDFEKIPGSPIGYNVGARIFNLFKEEKNLDEDGNIFRIGLMSGDNKRFLRKWFEVSLSNTYFYCQSAKDSLDSEKKWYPINSGGCFRKWYGNQETIVNWYHDGEEIKAEAVVRNNGRHWSRYIVGVDQYYKKGISWNAISSGSICLRAFDTGFLIGHSSVCGYCKDDNYTMALLNTPISDAILSVLSPTVNYGSTQVNKIPIIYKDEEKIDSLVEDNISISRADWDAHETSWDFKRNPLWEEQLQVFVDEVTETMPDLTIDNITGYHAPELLQPLSFLMDNYKARWEDLFMQLHANEEELNRQFISIYGLEDELQPDVPLNEITILQQGEISIDGEHIVWHDDVLMKQLVSYAIGCIMGRYGLDKKGLILANQGDTLADFTAQVPQPRFLPDDDGIVPLMDEQSPFPDNVVARLQEWVKVAFGSDHQAENLNYIEAALGKSIKDYMAKDFYKDHKRMYQNRPIYWLFASRKGAFLCLAYMHRMDAYTVGKVRMRYLLPYIEWLKGRIDALMARQAELSTTERRQLRDYGKWLEECREYDIRLHEVANNQIAIDLDDGVVVNHAKFGDVLAKLK